MHGALEIEPTAYSWHLQHISVWDTLSCTGTVTVIEPDGLSITDKAQPIFNSSNHQADEISNLQQLHHPTGVGSGEQLHLIHQNSGLCWYAGALAQCLSMVSCYPGWQGCWSHSALKVKLMSLSTEQLGRKGRGSVHQSVTDCLCYKTWAFLQGELDLSLLKSTWDKCNSFIGPCPIHRTANPLQKYCSFKCQGAQVAQAMGTSLLTCRDTVKSF